jgi:anti-anti-sigma factor
MQPNQIFVEKHGEITILDIKGDVTSSSENIVNDTYRSLESGSSKIVFKFEPGCYINSGGIAVIIQVLAESRRRNQRIGITGLSDHFQKIFKMVGITKFATIYPSVEGAAQGLTP